MIKILCATGLMLNLIGCATSREEQREAVIQQQRLDQAAKRQADAVPADPKPQPAEPEPAKN